MCAKTTRSVRVVVNQRGRLGQNGQLVLRLVVTAPRSERGSATHPGVWDAQRNQALNSAVVTLVRVSASGVTGAPVMRPAMRLLREASSVARRPACAVVHTRVTKVVPAWTPSCRATAAKRVLSIVQRQMSSRNVLVTASACLLQLLDVLRRLPAGLCEVWVKGLYPNAMHMPLQICHLTSSC